jgi:hypothetical protein
VEDCIIKTTLRKKTQAPLSSDKGACALCQDSALALRAGNVRLMLAPSDSRWSASLLRPEKKGTGPLHLEDPQLT